METQSTKKSNWIVRNWRKLRQCSFTQISFIFGSIVVAIALFYSLNGTFTSKKKKLKNALYGEEIGNNGLRYKHGEHIYNPKTGDILLDSITWLHVPYGDSIGIVAKNKKRAYINLNTGALITPLNYTKAWEFASDRGIMIKNDSIYIFRRDGSQVNPMGFKYYDQYELSYHKDKLVLECEYDQYGLLDTAAQWILPPEYKKIVNDHRNHLYNTQNTTECIVYNYDLEVVLQGEYKNVEVDWSQGIIATEHNGIQHLFDYKGKLVYEVIFKDIRELTYKTERLDQNGNAIWESTGCYAYTNYNNKEGLMDKHYKVLTAPLFNSITAKSKGVFFAAFGDYYDEFGTLIDNHGQPIR